MNYLSLIMTFVLLVIVPQTESVYAARTDKDSHLLNLRTGDHPEFMRIVVEGPAPFISKVKISQIEKEFILCFSSEDFTIQTDQSLFNFRKDKADLIFILGKYRHFKHFFLKNPERLVIDIDKKGGPEKMSKKHREEQEKVLNIKAAGAADKNDIRDTDASSMSVDPHPDSETSDDGNEEAPVTVEVNNAEHPSGKYEFIPDNYYKLWSVLRIEKNPYKVLEELPKFKPADVESMAVYRLIQGEAYHGIKDYPAAIKFLRLAYIYSSNNRLKELALFLRGQIYLEFGLYYEARSNFKVFIKEFPSSVYLAEAHLGLAKSMAETDLFTEAVTHYEKAGNEAAVTFSKANALQKLGRVEEAAAAYNEAVLTDMSYLKESPETTYYLGENMRMTGKLKEAKKHFNSLGGGPFMNHSALSLGLIAIEESRVKDAIKKFQSVTFARDSRLRVRALFHLSLAYLKQGKLKESTKTLEEVRVNHYHSDMYKEALLVLSKLYRKEGRMKEAVSMLKELVYNRRPPAEAFAELESILTQVGQEQGAEGDNTVRFVDLWRDVSLWLLDESREEFLLTVSEKLRNEGEMYLKLSLWLLDNTSENIRKAVALNLAAYYEEVGSLKDTVKYLRVAKKYMEPGDDAMRVEAKIHYAGGDSESALKKLFAIQEVGKDDFKIISDVVFDLSTKNSAMILDAIALYEKTLNSAGQRAEDYVKLADILYQNNREEKALKFYRLAHGKKPADEWTVYMIGRIMNEPGTKEIYTELTQSDTLLSRVAKTRLMELDLLDKVNEVY